MSGWSWSWTPLRLHDEEAWHAMSRDAQWLLMLMYAHCDTHGRGPAGPVSLKSTLHVTEAFDGARLLREVVKAGFARLYLVDGKEYWELDRYGTDAPAQFLGKRAAGRYPGPDGQVPESARTKKRTPTVQTVSPHCPDSVSPLSPNLEPWSEVPETVSPRTEPLDPTQENQQLTPTVQTVSPHCPDSVSPLSPKSSLDETRRDETKGRPTGRPLKSSAVPIAHAHPHASPARDIQIPDEASSTSEAAPLGGASESPVPKYEPNACPGMWELLDRPLHEWGIDGSRLEVALSDVGRRWTPTEAYAFACVGAAMQARQDYEYVARMRERHLAAGRDPSRDTWIAKFEAEAARHAAEVARLKAAVEAEGPHGGHIASEGEKRQAAEAARTQEALAKLRALEAPRVTA